ncbi:hypothetical protein [Vibrio mangrovi]|uniref:Uncharacterized protein n=1 Tax=Vibrio mangrovi TaxID=474394 RepID=A0A1Y6IN65_9VIBR|nr:hypothetical protein [Vibrio mangrovi]MDW6004116.1 hypothetical protein [Vibrio mangrovi]SMR99087.1 hypothetical protein VIM7927_00309 [Vibrio mangrovi]
MQWLKKIILIAAIIVASLYMASVGFLTYLFSSADDKPQEQQVVEQSVVSEPASAENQ